MRTEDLLKLASRNKHRHGGGGGVEEAAPSDDGGGGGHDVADDGEEEDEEEVLVIRATESQLRLAEEQFMEIQNLNDVKATSLHNFALTACVVQFGQAIVLFYLSAKSTFKLGLITNFPNPNYPKYPAPDQIAYFSVLYLAPCFIIMSGTEHFLSSMIFRDKYEYYVSRHQNPSRWNEYAFSASTMRWLIAQLVGVTDVHLLVCIFVLTLMTIQCGATHESVNAKARADGLPQNWRPFWLGWVGHLTPWAIILNYFAKGVQGGYMLSYDWAIVLVLIFLDTSFGFLFAMQWKRIPPFDGMCTGFSSEIVVCVCR